MINLFLLKYHSSERCPFQIERYVVAQSETDAMLYFSDRINREGRYCLDLIEPADSCMHLTITDDARDTLCGTNKLMQEFYND